MSKIVFFSIPAKGHTNPTLAVVRELVSRGHQVWYYSYNAFEEEIEATGAAFVSCDKYDAQLNLSPEDGAKLANDLVFSMKVLADTTIALCEKITADMQEINPDCIVADSMAVWGRLVAKKLGIPYVCSTTTLAFNRHLGKVMNKIEKERRYEEYISNFQAMRTMAKANKEIRRVRKKGYKIKSALDILKSDKKTHTIVYTSPEFQPYSKVFSDKFAFVGPILKEPTVDTRKRLDTLVYVSMGTVNNKFPKLYQSCIGAFAESSYQVIMSVGNLVEPENFSNAPINISVKESVDQISVLQKSDIFITHCGMNSVSEALYLGVPIIMLPQTTEQKCVALRVEELGAGVILPKHDATTIYVNVRDMLKNPTYKENAEKIAEGFRKCSGAKGAADKILSVIDEAQQQKAKKQKK